MTCYSLADESFQDQNTIMPAESKSIAHKCVHRNLPGLVGHVIQIAFRIGRFVVDGGGIQPVSIALMPNNVSSAPVAAIMCPVIALVPLMGTR